MNKPACRWISMVLRLMTWVAGAWWIVDHYVRNFFHAVTEFLEEGVRNRVLAPLTPVQFHYLLVGSTVIFSMAPECRLLTGEDPQSDAMVDAHADAVALLLTRAAGDT